MDDDERFVQALHGAARAWRGRFERCLKTAGVTMAGWNALAAVAGAAADAPPSQRDLAMRLGVDGATLVATIDRLATAGLVERLPDPHDRRVKLVAPTRSGRALAGRLDADAAALRGSALDGFDAARLASATVLLEELRDLLEPP